jgi:hypothetical protein
MNIIAYAYDSDHHCPGCTCLAANVGTLKREPPLELGTDANGLAFDLVDREGNRVSPIHDIDEPPEEGLYCADCGGEITPPLMLDAHFDRFSISMPPACARDCSAAGRVDDAVEAWLGRSRIDWSKIDPDDIRAELAEYGAWDESDLTDDDENRMRILWIAACNIREGGDL